MAKRRRYVTEKLCKFVILLKYSCLKTAATTNIYNTYADIARGLKLPIARVRLLCREALLE